MMTHKFFPILSLYLLGAILLLTLTPSYSEAKGEESTATLKRCEQLLTEKKDLNRQMNQVKEEQEKLQKQYQSARAAFEKYKSKLVPLTGCALGKPDNTPECEKVLTGQREATGQLDKIQLSQKENSKKKSVLENKLLNTNANIQLLQCEE